MKKLFLAISLLSLFANASGKDGDGETGNRLWVANDPYYVPTIKMKSMTNPTWSTTVKTLNLEFYSEKPCENNEFIYLGTWPNIYGGTESLYAYRNMVYVLGGYYSSENISQMPKEVQKEFLSIAKACNHKKENSANGSYAFGPKAKIPLPEFNQLFVNQVNMIVDRANLLLSQLDYLRSQYPSPLQLRDYQLNADFLFKGLKEDLDIGLGDFLKGLRNISRSQALVVSGIVGTLDTSIYQRLSAHSQYYSFNFGEYLKSRNDYLKIMQIHKESLRYVVKSPVWMQKRAEFYSVYTQELKNLAIEFTKGGDNYSSEAKELLDIEIYFQ